MDLHQVLCWITRKVLINVHGELTDGSQRQCFCYKYHFLLSFRGYSDVLSSKRRSERVGYCCRGSSHSHIDLNHCYWRSREYMVQETELLANRKMSRAILLVHRCTSSRHQNSKNSSSRGDHSLVHGPRTTFSSNAGYIRACPSALVIQVRPLQYSESSPRYHNINFTSTAQTSNTSHHHNAPHAYSPRCPRPHLRHHRLLRDYSPSRP